MQMQEGVGRGGYRLIALVFAGLGVLGIITTLVAFGQENLEGLFKWLGFALTMVSIVALLSVVLVVLAPVHEPRTKRAPAPEPAPEPAVLELADVPEATGALTDPGVEFADAEPAPVPEPMPRGPPPRPQPAPKPFGPPPSRPKDTKGWPERKGASGRTRRDVAEARTQAEETVAPLEREPPLIMARTAASAEAAGLPDNISVGKCGNCGVLLMAPKKRPIRLQCPRCERVHTLA